MKHDGGWHLTRHDDGSYLWTSPTARLYVKPPTELPH